MSLKINYEEVKQSKNFEEILDMAKDMMDQVREFEGITKAQLVLLLAEKLEEAKYPQLEIKERILERLGDRVTAPYVSKCLPDRFKRPAKIAATKAAAERRATAKKAQMNAGVSGTATVMEDPILTQPEDGENNITNNNHREQLPDIQPEIATESVEIGGTGSIEDISNYPYEYIESLENTIKALKGEIPFLNRQVVVKVAKMDKGMGYRFEKAMMSSKSGKLYMTVDMKDNNVTNIYSEQDWKKQNLYPK